MKEPTPTCLCQDPVFFNEPCPAHPPNTTPTTLRTLEETLDIYTHKTDRSLTQQDPHLYEKAKKEVRLSIQEQLKALLPNKMHSESPEMLKNGWFDEEYRAFNQAVDQIEKAIEEWAK